MRLSTLLDWHSSLIILIIWSFSIFHSGSAQAQQRVSIFPEDSVLYLSTLEQHFEFIQNSKKKEAENFLDNFRLKWQSGFFSPEIKSQIYVTSNKMLDNKMPAIPFYSEFLNTLIHLMESKKDNESILAWIKASQYLLDTQSTREFTSFVRSSDVFFTRSLVFSDRTLQWKVSSDKYSMQMNKDTLRIVFPRTDLICYTKGDSTNILGTRGIYLPFTNKWIGDGGKVSWSRANYSADSVYADLSKYTIPLLYSKFSADSVQFHHLLYFEKPLIGRLEEEILASRRGNKAIFPKFISYEKRWEIQNIFPNIDYTGGILIEGAQLIGFGDEDTQASLIIRRHDTAFIKLRSTNFNILPNSIRSEYTSVSIRHKNDSIYHNSLHMNFTKETQVFSFIRDDQGLTANPFYDSYHQIEMYVEAVYWKMGENRISFDMAMGRTKSPARFESNNYFSEYRFDHLRGIDKENPLVSLKHYRNENKSNIVYFDEYAEYLRMPKEQVQLALLTLAHQGFLLYDAVNERAVLGDKIDFYLKANAGDIDSDVIRFESNPGKDEANAVLQIDNFKLQINGLDRIILSDSQNLIIEPSNRHIVVGKNKDFQFDGKITAGRLSFATTNSSFDYTEFKLNMPTIDSLWFWVNGAPLPEGGFEHINIKSGIHDLSGNLLIDHPDNKSGLKPLNEYPIFNSVKDSYVYYNNKSIQKGVYNKESFYFHVNPFTLVSLNNFETEDIEFQGYLASANIFPDIAQPLTVQKDYSLGFIDKLSNEGIMAYGGKGQFYNEINLSNQGLKGNGSLSFINSVTTSDGFVFLPDSMKVLAQNFELKPSTGPVEFPRASGQNTAQKWLPYEETMLINSTNKSISMYEDETSMQGQLTLKPTSLSGSGIFHFKVAKMIADQFSFKNKIFDTDKCDFADVGMNLENFKAHTDFTKRTVIFTSNGGSSKVDFPENLYVCYMDEAKWYMDQGLTEYASSFSDNPDQFSGLSLRQLAETEYKGSDFVSTHPRQDSLSFYSTIARFNSKDKIIEAEGVHYIKSADAVIFPEKSKITILKNANMVPLQNAQIITNAVTKYHEIKNANVKINGRKSYSGTGDYVYIDKNDHKQTFHFDEIGVDSVYQTVAQGEIFDNDNFTLSPEFYFRGKVNLAASRKFLEFDGGFNIKNECLPSQSWIKFTSVIDPENILIPIAVQPVVPNVSRQQKYVGVLNSSARQKMYSAFLSNKIDYYDSIILTASGFIKYDAASKEYRISSKEKLNQMIRPENYFSLRTEDCSTYGEGEINLDVNFIDLKMKSYGNIQMKDSIAKLHLGAAIDFHFSENALSNIFDQFSAAKNNFVDNSTPYYSKMIAGFMGMDEAEQYLSRQLLGNQRRLPSQLIHTMFLNDLNLTWNGKLGAYVSDGMIGIGNLDRYRINALVKGNVEIKKSRAGDELILYFEINGQWYFFKYNNNVMQVLSSNEDFNKIIRSDMDAKGEKNRLKENKDTQKRSNYRYVICREEEKDDFLNQLKTN